MVGTEVLLEAGAWVLLVRLRLRRTGVEVVLRERGSRYLLGLVVDVAGRIALETGLDRSGVELTLAELVSVCVLLFKLLLLLLLVLVLLVLLLVQLQLVGGLLRFG